MDTGEAVVSEHGRPKRSRNLCEGSYGVPKYVPGSTLREHVPTQHRDCRWCVQNMS